MNLLTSQGSPESWSKNLAESEYKLAVFFGQLGDREKSHNTKRSKMI